MKIFILEDDPARMMWFRERLINHDITHAESCTQFDRFTPPYDVVFFDHDLGGRQMDEHEDNGEEFAKMIGHGKLDAIAIIHSYNGPGADNIRAALGGGFIAPFRGNWFNSIVDRYIK